MIIIIIIILIKIITAQYLRGREGKILTISREKYIIFNTPFSCSRPHHTLKCMSWPTCMNIHQQGMSTKKNNMLFIDKKKFQAKHLYSRPLPSLLQLVRIYRSVKYALLLTNRR